MHPLRIASFNVHGWKSSSGEWDNRAAVTDFARNRNIDILCLQEVYHDPDFSGNLRF
jgi:exonuclease III